MALYKLHLINNDRISVTGETTIDLKDEKELHLGLASKNHSNPNDRIVFNNLIKSPITPLTFHFREKLSSNLNSTSSWFLHKIVLHEAYLNFTYILLPK